MAVKVTGMICGQIGADAKFFLDGGEGRVKLPVPAYLIEHADGMLVYDTGLHPETQTDPEGRLGRSASLFEINFPAGHEITGRLDSMGVAATDVERVVASHLHFDHAGGNELMKHARLVVQKTEWDAAHDPEAIASNGYYSADFDHDMDLEIVDGEHDLFGDGSVRLIPTFGHTPGHQSMVIEVGDRHLVLTGDACYFRRTIDELNLPRFVADRDAMVRSLHQLRALEEAGMELIFGHDGSQWDLDAGTTLLGEG